MQLADLVACSNAVAATRARGRKTEVLAATLSAAAAEERPLAALWLAGQLRQDKLGVGFAQVRDALATPAAIGEQSRVRALHARGGGGG